MTQSRNGKDASCVSLSVDLIVSAIMIDHAEDVRTNSVIMPRLMRPNDVAVVLGVSKRTVYSIIARGDLPACRIGLGAGTIRIHPDDLASYLEQLRSPDR